MSAEYLTGGITVVEQHEACEMPEDAKIAWQEIYAPLVGTKHTPITYVGPQIVRGVNHVYLAERVMPYRDRVYRHIVEIKINEFNGVYTPVSEKVLY